MEVGNTQGRRHSLYFLNCLFREAYQLWTATEEGLGLRWSDVILLMTLGQTEARTSMTSDEAEIRAALI